MQKLEYWKNKNVVITGGTSGLGKALALQLNELGARVAVIARRRELLDRLPPEIIAVQGDVSDKKAIYPLAGEVQSRLGDVDVLVNGASYLGTTPLRLLADTDCEDMEQALQTNVLGPFRLIKALLPSLLLRRGVVVNISSDAAVSAYPAWGSYSLSKAALDHMSRIFDEELKGQGVRFLAVDPGDMRTPMHFAAIPEADPKQLRDPADSSRALIGLVAAQDYSSVRRKL